MHTSQPADSTVRPILLAIALGLAWTSGVGCRRSDDATLTIATDLDGPALAGLAADFASRAADRGEPAPAIRWARTSPGVDPARWLRDGAGADVVLTLALPRGAISHPSGAGLETIGLGPGRGSAWWWTLTWGRLARLRDDELFESRALPVPDGWDVLDDPRLDGLIALDDPRHDPATLALASDLLESRGWAEGYATLVRAAGQAGPFGRTRGAAEALVGRGGAAVAPAILGPSESSENLRTTSPGAPISLGVGVARGTPRLERAVAFLRFLDETYGVSAGSARSVVETRLLAELLGATLVDAQGELVAAVDALARSPSARLEAFLTEAPPWPPASVQKLTGDDPTGELAGALADQVATGLAARTWLLDRWDRAPRPIDGRLLADLAGAADGALAAEPRFLRWLSAEWSAWARQRYRRVARQARAGSAARGPEAPSGALP